MIKFNDNEIYDFFNKGSILGFKSLESNPFYKKIDMDTLEICNFIINYKNGENDLNKYMLNKVINALLYQHEDNIDPEFKIIIDVYSKKYNLNTESELYYKGYKNLKYSLMELTNAVTSKGLTDKTKNFLKFIYDRDSEIIINIYNYLNNYYLNETYNSFKVKDFKLLKNFKIYMFLYLNFMDILGHDITKDHMDTIIKIFKDYEYYIDNRIPSIYKENFNLPNMSSENNMYFINTLYEELDFETFKKFNKHMFKYLDYGIIRNMSEKQEIFLKMLEV